MERLTSRLTRMGLASVTLAGILVGCANSPKPAAADLLTDNRSPSTSTTSGPPPAGTWISHLTRDRAAQQLRAAGLGKWTDMFFKAEGWPKEPHNLTAVYALTPTKGASDDTWRGTFQAAYFENGGYWHVGWKGPLNVRGRGFSVHDDYSDTTDRFTWHGQGHNLTVHWNGSDQKSWKGIPSPVYMVAYFTDPLKASDCPMDPATNC